MTSSSSSIGDFTSIVFLFFLFLDFFDGGGIGISTSVPLSQNIGVNAIQKEAVFAGVGIGTLAPTCVADFAHAGTLGITTTHRYFLPPKVGTTDRNGINYS